MDKEQQARPVAGDPTEYDALRLGWIISTVIHNTEDLSRTGAPESNAYEDDPHLYR